MKTSRLTSKYQATIPADVRAELGIKAGDRIAWLVEGEGAVSVRRAEDGPDDPNWRDVTLVDSRTHGEWLSEEDEAAFRDL